MLDFCRLLTRFLEDSESVIWLNDLVITRPIKANVAPSLDGSGQGEIFSCSVAHVTQRTCYLDVVNAFLENDANRTQNIKIVDKNKCFSTFYKEECGRIARKISARRVVQP